MGEPEDVVVQDEWRREGTCGACAHFRADFGEAPDLYGHCKMYTRTGSRGSSDYACPEFRPLPGFGEKVSLGDAHTVALNRAGGVRPSASRAGSPSIRSRRGSSGARVVRRRGDGHGGTLERDTTPVDDDILAALVGEPGGTVDRDSLRDVLLEVIENFLVVDEVELGKKWQGGTVIIQPEDPDLKAHEIPVEALFHKVVMIRDRLRVLEAKINAHEKLSDADKIDLQQYISKSYGSLTTFNTLFRDAKHDGFSSK